LARDWVIASLQDGIKTMYVLKARRQRLRPERVLNCGQYAAFSDEIKRLEYENWLFLPHNVLKIRNDSSSHFKKFTDFGIFLELFYGGYVRNT